MNNDAVLQIEAMRGEMLRHDADETHPRIQALTAAIDALQRQGEAVGTQVRPRHFPDYGWREVSRLDLPNIDKIHPEENWERRLVYALPPQPPTGEQTS